MLETIREFAADQLDASGETDETLRRHAARYLEFAAPGSLPFDSDELTQWLPRAEPERANLRAALGWLIEHGTVDERAPARAAPLLAVDPSRAAGRGKRLVGAALWRCRAVTVRSGRARSVEPG